MASNNVKHASAVDDSCQ